jgi:hypothetical protein
VPERSADSAQPNPEPAPVAHEAGEVAELKREVLDLKIANRGKDMFIDQLQKERQAFAEERREYVGQLMTFNRRVGELETRLLQIQNTPAASASAEDGRLLPDR